MTLVTTRSVTTAAPATRLPISTLSRTNGCASIIVARLAHVPSRTNEYNNSKELSRDSLHWHFPHYQGEGSYPASTIRVGNHLLIHNYHHNAPLPYDIANDPGETKNLMASLEETDAHIPQELSR